MRGAGTSLAGQAIGAGVVLDVSRLDQIVSVDAGRAARPRAAGRRPGRPRRGRARARPVLRARTPRPPAARRSAAWSATTPPACAPPSTGARRTASAACACCSPTAPTPGWARPTSPRSTGPFAAARAVHDSLAGRDRGALAAHPALRRRLQPAGAGRRPAAPRAVPLRLGGHAGARARGRGRARSGARPARLDDHPPRLARRDRRRHPRGAAVGALGGRDRRRRRHRRQPRRARHLRRRRRRAARRALRHRRGGAGRARPDVARPTIPGVAGVVAVDGAEANARIVRFRRDLQGTINRSVRGGRRPTTVVEDGAVPVERLGAYLSGPAPGVPRRGHGVRHLRPRLGRLRARAAAARPVRRRGPRAVPPPGRARRRPAGRATAARCRASTATASCAPSCCRGCSASR